MRTILYRGKRIDNGEWIEGNLFVPNQLLGGVYICPNTSYFNFYPDLDPDQETIKDEELKELSKNGISIGHFHSVIPETVGEFTGLILHNGTKIYDGDILYCDDAPGSHHVIEWNDVEMRWTDTRMEDGDSQTMYEGFASLREFDLFGNIHDNAELMKGEEL